MVKPRVLAFYLPQFHPLKENDEWWGKGFTEWTNVGKAKPLFRGHDQPRVPTELGYYDLRLPIVREEQAQLAREAGVEAFMYWHYWFGNGKTLMADIFREVVESGKPDFPFCLGWANHSWYSKLWNKDGTSTNKLLLEQTYPGEADARMYFESLLPAFKDDRYVKVDGKPFFYIFAPNDIPDLYLRLFEKWAQEEGFPGMFFVANIVNETQPKEDFLKRGFSAVTYQRLAKKMPSYLLHLGKYGRGIYRLGRRIKGFLKHRPPFMYDYREVADQFVSEADYSSDVIPTILPQWDHSPRSGWNGTLLVNATPAAFKKAVRTAIDAVRRKSPQEQLIFLKSWNEWGEGNYMEPDLTNGRGFIDALREVLDEESGKATSN